MTCSFTCLPPEIRLQIYSYLLLLPPYTRRSPASEAPPPIHAAITLTSRLVHAESSPVLYAKNTFLAHPDLLTSFPRLRASYQPVKEASAISHIRRVYLVIRLDTDLRFTRDAAARMLSGLELVVIDVVQAMFMGVQGCENLRVLEGVRGVKEVVFRGSTTGFETYLEWLRRKMESDEDRQGELEWSG